MSAFEIPPEDLTTVGQGPAGEGPFARATLNEGTSTTNSGVSISAGGWNMPGLGTSVAVDGGAGQFLDAGGNVQLGAGLDIHAMKAPLIGAPTTVDNWLNTFLTGPSVFDDFDVPLIGDSPLTLETSSAGAGFNATVGGSSTSVGACLDAGTWGGTLGTPEESVRGGFSLGECLGLRAHYGDADGDHSRELGFGLDLATWTMDWKSEAVGSGFAQMGGEDLVDTISGYFDWATSQSEDPPAPPPPPFESGHGPRY